MWFHCKITCVFLCGEREENVFHKYEKSMRKAIIFAIFKKFKFFCTTKKLFNKISYDGKFLF